MTDAINSTIAPPEAARPAVLAPALARRVRSRFFAPSLGLALMAAFAALYALDRPLYMHALTAYGIDPFRWPFVDAYSNLAAIDCARQGVDVYAADPCDAVGWRYNYSPLLLLAQGLPVGRAWTPFLGAAIDLAFLGSLALLPKPRDLKDALARAAIVISPMTAYGLERANFDLLLCALVLTAGAALASKGPGRLIAYPLLLAAALLKYYPALALGVVLRERRRMSLAVMAACAAVLIGFVVGFGHDILRTAALVPVGTYFAEAFGAVNLPRGLAMLLAHGVLPGAWRGPAGDLFFALALAYGLAKARRQIGDPGFRQGFADLGKSERDLLVVGGAVLLGCFLTCQNNYYRAVFLLPALPGLAALDKTARGGLKAVAMAVFLAWSECIRHLLVGQMAQPSPWLGLWRMADIGLWLARELVWWRLAATLGAGLWLFARQAPLWPRPIRAALEGLTPNPRAGA